MNKKKIWIIIGALLLLAVVLEAALAHPHSTNWWDVLPGFDILFGLGGSFALIALAKGVLGPVFRKEEDFYDKGGDDQ